MLIENWEEVVSIITKERLPFGYEIPTRGPGKETLKQLSRS
jgi:hypothetical protein